MEGDPQIANPKSLNEVEMEEWGELTKEGNFILKKIYFQRFNHFPSQNLLLYF